MDGAFNSVSANQVNVTRIDASEIVTERPMQVSNLVVNGTSTFTGDVNVTKLVASGNVSASGMTINGNAVAIEKENISSVLNSIGIIPYGTTLPDAEDVFNLPERLTDYNSYLPNMAYSYYTGIFEDARDVSVPIKNTSNVVFDYGNRVVSPTSYILSYENSNVNIPKWTPLSDTSNVNNVYSNIYSLSPYSLGITSRFSTYNTENQNFTPTDIINIVNPTFGTFIDKGYALPTPDFKENFKHMFAGSYSLSGASSNVRLNGGVIGIEFGYNTINSIIPNNVFVSYVSDDLTSAISFQNKMFNGGFFLTNKGNATDSNLYINPVTLPVTTDATVFKNIYGTTTGSIALYDPVNSHVHLYFSGSSNTISTGATSTDFNTNTDGIGIQWNEKAELKYFAGSFAIVKKRDKITSSSRPFSVATSYDVESFLMQISSNISVKFNSYRNDVLQNVSNGLNMPSVDNIINMYTIDSKYQGVICPKVGNGKQSYDIMSLYYPYPNAYQTPTILPIIGDNPYTSGIEKFSTPSAFVLWNNDTLKNWWITIQNYNGSLFTDTPEQISANLLSSNLSANVVNCVDIISVHELSHSLRDMNLAMLSAKVAYGGFNNTEGHAVSIEMQRCKTLGAGMANRNNMFPLYVRNLFRGAFNVHRKHHVYIGDLHTGITDSSNRILGSFFSAYAESMLFNYIVENYDANQQVERYTNDLIQNQVNETLTLANYPVHLSLAIAHPKLAQNCLDKALQSITSAQGSIVSLSNAFVDFCVSVALLRNNSTIPDRYKTRFPYWLLNRRANYWSTYRELGVTCTDLAFWSDALEGVPCGSWPVTTSYGFNSAFTGDTIHPIWPKVGSIFSNGLEYNSLGTWSNADTQTDFTYTSDTYRTDSLVHQVEDLTCVSYVIPFTKDGASTVYGTSDVISNVSVTVNKGDWVFKVVQFIPDGGNGQFLQNFNVSTDGGSTYSSVTEYAINITDSVYTTSTDTWSDGTPQTIDIKFDLFNTSCHGTNWSGVDIYYFPRLVCVHRKNHVHNQFRTLYPVRCIYSGKITMKATLA
jgi:hypothetical protein